MIEFDLSVQKIEVFSSPDMFQGIMTIQFDDFTEVVEVTDYSFDIVVEHLLMVQRKILQGYAIPTPANLTHPIESVRKAAAFGRKNNNLV